MKMKSTALQFAFAFNESSLQRKIPAHFTLSLYPIVVINGNFVCSLSRLSQIGLNAKIRRTNVSLMVILFVLSQDCPK